MKVSRYHHVVSDNHGSYLFNAYRRGLHEVDPEVVAALEMLGTGQQDWDKDLSPAILATLQSEGYVIPDDFDEHARLLQERESLRLSRHAISLTICPTIDCNFGCPYCFEGEDKPQERMTDETMAWVVRFWVPHRSRPAIKEVTGSG